MMRDSGINLLVEVEVEPLRTTLRKNRERHALMVKEANEGYIAKALEDLSKRRLRLERGEACPLNNYGLRVPQDHTEAYDVVLDMLRAHQMPTVKLSADEYRHLVMDRWNWTQAFVTNNSEYSASTRAFAAEQRIGREEQ